MSATQQRLTYGKVTADILKPMFNMSAGYLGLLGISVATLLYGGYCWYYQLTHGLGAAGYQPPVFWGVYITTFVFWIGIGHAGTLISAVLFLFRSKWRTGVYRASEAMTIFAVMTAGLFPAIHVGRAWNAYWLFPYPNQRQLWQNFKSPLMWDVFAVSTYFSVSTIFFYIGLIPDIAAVRDRTRGVIHKIYKGLALGWYGTDRQWRHYMAAYGFFAAFATPLVLSVHSVVSWDFAMA
ncbi:MAG: NrfD/PsrC family molybdoenzyme membrane anchor subunit, partial [Myxococcota bacterium]|nr:NrfD/PsrC family molybdoenzyme membrane anchor subunit [Myxococcota bacterium]